jgi:drug/metabolite transporter (DMT)-like permease
MPDTRKQPAGRLAGLLAVGYVVLWASAYVPSKVAATGAPPLWFLVARFSAAGLVMAAVALGLRRPFPRDWLVYAVLGVLANAAYLGCTYTALGLGLAAGVASIVASTNPLILALVAPRLLAEPLTGLKTLGLALGFAGVIGVVVARGGSASAQPALVGLAFIGVASNVASTILFKRARGSTDLLAINTIQLLAAGVALIPVAFALEGFPAAQPTPELLESFAYLVGVLSVGASLLWFWLLSHGAASRVSAFYFLTPVFGLFFGAALLNETVVPTDALGLVAIALGIVLVQRS